MKKIFSLILLITLMVSCSNDVTDNEYMWEPTSLTFPVTGNTQQVKIFSDYPLYIVKYPSWLTITPRSGSGTFTANVQADENETGSELNGEILVSATENDTENYLFKIPVKQEK